MADDQAIQETKKSAISYARAWGESPFPPTILAAFVTAQHVRPYQFLPLVFPPVLLLSSYMNINGYKNDAAGTSAAWSALYFLLAWRRKQPLMQKSSLRGIVRGATMGLCVTNALSGGLVWAVGKKNKKAAAQEGSEVA